MPPRRPQADRNYSDMVDDNALHISTDQATAGFGNASSYVRATDLEDLREKAAQAEQLQELVEQLQTRTNDLVVGDGTLMVHGFQLTPTGLIPPDQFGEDEWQALGLLLFRLEGSIQWLIGDWIVYGGVVGWGDIPVLATKIGREPQTLRDYAYVSRKIQLSFRNDKLSYTHHVVAAKADLSPDEQRYAFEGALHFGFSVAEFRKWINQGMPKDGLRREDEQPTLPAELKFGSLAHQLDKYTLRDPVTAKPQEVETVLSYVSQMRIWLDAFEKKWTSSSK